MVVYPLQQKCKSQCRHRRRAPDGILVPLDDHLPEPRRRAILYQVLDTIETMEHKGPRQKHLDSTLDQQWQRRERSRHRGRLQVPAGERCNQVADAVDVQAACEGHARESLEDGRADVGLLLVVDLEVGRYGAVEPLLRQEGLRLARGHALGGGGAAGLNSRDGRCGEARGVSGCGKGQFLCIDTANASPNVPER